MPADQAPLLWPARQQAGAGLQPSAEDGQAARAQRPHPRLRARPQQEDEVSTESN